MNRTPVKSSRIKSIGYNEANKNMHVEFADGSLYEYQNVEIQHHARLVNSPSIGSHFHRNVKGKFPQRKLS